MTQFHTCIYYYSICYFCFLSRLLLGINITIAMRVAFPWIIRVQRTSNRCWMGIHTLSGGLVDVGPSILIYLIHLPSLERCLGSYRVGKLGAEYSSGDSEGEIRLQRLFPMLKWFILSHIHPTHKHTRIHTNTQCRNSIVYINKATW